MILSRHCIPLAAAITLLSASLSLTGGFALLLTYNKIPEFQSPVRKILVFLTVADIFSAFGYIVGTANFLRLDDSQKNSTDPICKAQSFVTTFASLSSFAWTSIIAVHLFLAIRRQQDFERNRLLKIVYYILGWVVPAIISICFLVLDKLGRDVHGRLTVTGLWCWVKVEHSNGTRTSGIVSLLMSGKLWELMTYVLSFSMYMLLKINTYFERQKNRSYCWSDVDGANLTNEDERFCFTWLVLYLLRFWGTIRFFFAVADVQSDEIIFADTLFMYFQCAGDSAQALGNFILFCLLDKNIRKKYLEMIGDFCKTRKKYELLNAESDGYQSTLYTER
ncbi:G-protein coupled receptor 157-like [Saccostrea echinata]|uniref:G-protein coupled receptor 157-like n=1 Tax=Saccostrea echinata TaxID=191078 RepID=UPI002A82A054|nr:G-protein coupled receptor 157-like [Saccostrea echinata]